VEKEFSVKVGKVIEHGKAETDLEVEVNLGGKLVLKGNYRVNRVGEEAKQVATAAALAHAKALNLGKGE